MTMVNAPARRDFSRAQLTLIRRTIARACTDVEFDQFIEAAQSSGLDPLRRQIAPLITNAQDPEKRRLVPWATIDGLRVIAARSNDYRPMDGVPIVEHDKERIDPATNPLGLTRAEVRAWKYRDGAWFAVVGEAWWDEYAPVRLEGDVLVLDASWRRMPRVMLVKCAEAIALRRGWPDCMSGIYGEEELHALRRVQETATETLQRHEAGRDHKPEGRRALWFVFDPAAGLESVIDSDVFERLELFYNCARTKTALSEFELRNKQALTTFWEWHPELALKAKQLAETKMERLSRKRAAKSKQRIAKVNKLGAAPRDAGAPPHTNGAMGTPDGDLVS